MKSEPETGQQPRSGSFLSRHMGAQLDVVSIHPHERAGQSHASEFGRIAAAIDQAEKLANERVGGPTAAESAAIRRQEKALPPPATVDDWQWLAERLARAVINGWTPRAASPLVRLAMLESAA
jgi:hypothetical protein